MTDKQAHFTTCQVPGVGAPSRVMLKLGSGKSAISILSLRHPFDSSSKKGCDRWSFQQAHRFGWQTGQSLFGAQLQWLLRWHFNVIFCGNSRWKKIIFQCDKALNFSQSLRHINCGCNGTRTLRLILNCSAQPLDSNVLITVEIIVTMNSLADCWYPCPTQHSVKPFFFFPSLLPYNESLLPFSIDQPAAHFTTCPLCVSVSAKWTEVTVNFFIRGFYHSPASLHLITCHP